MQRTDLYDNPRVNQWGNAARPDAWSWYGPSASTFDFANGLGHLTAAAYLSDGVWQSVFYSYDQQERVADQWTRSHGQPGDWQKEHFDYNTGGQRIDYTAAGRVRVLLRPMPAAAVTALKVRAGNASEEVVRRGAGQ
jgi:hypothetical protein